MPSPLLHYNEDCLADEHNRKLLSEMLPGIRNRCLRRSQEDRRFLGSIGAESGRVDLHPGG
jgi:hypothetical protein